MRESISPRRVANALLGSLMRSLADVQRTIILRERFGDDAVLHPEIQTRLDAKLWTLAELTERHAVLVEQIRDLSARIERAEEADIFEFVQSIKARRGE